MDPTHIQDIPILAAVITVSTSRTKKEDVSGPAIMDLLKSANIAVVHYSVIPDLFQEIQREVLVALEKANCIITSGGTGLTPDDCTIEAIEPLLDKKIDGFGELFRAKSFEEIGTRALLSRAIGGIIAGKAVFCIPGSVGAGQLATKEIIIPEIRHILTHASKR
jgi:molybdenum cofactor biosynthesis protein B